MGRMIKPAFLAKQVAKSRRDGETSAFLRRLIFFVVDRVARERYGDEYPVRCLQVGCAVQRLLRNVGVRSNLWVGAVCVPGAYRDPEVFSWIGFWDQDHHFWLRTEFGEIVDLSAAQMHLHPRRSRKDGYGMPALWWGIGRSPLPDVLRYLPDTLLPGVQLPDVSEQTDLETFLEAVQRSWDRWLESAKVEDILFSPILDGIDTLNRLVETQHPWASGARRADRLGFALPPWIEARTDELFESYRSGAAPSSPLANAGVFREEHSDRNSSHGIAATRGNT